MLLPLRSYSPVWVAKIVNLIEYSSSISAAAMRVSTLGLPYILAVWGVKDWIFLHSLASKLTSSPAKYLATDTKSYSTSRENSSSWTILLLNTTLPVIDSILLNTSRNIS